MKEKKSRTTKALAIYDDVHNEFKKERLMLQSERQDPDLSTNDVVMQLIENTRKLRELQKKENAK